MLFSLNLWGVSIDLFVGFKIDNFYIIYKVIFICFIFVFFIISRNVFLLDKVYNFEYIYLILLSLYGSFVILFTKNLFIFFVAIEIQMLCYYILASLKRYSNFATEAGIKYFLLGTFSSSLLLFGISLIYGIFGSLDIYNIFFMINYNSFFLYDILLFFSFFFFFSGLMFKLGAAPFHWWVPDVYEGSMSIVTLFFH